MPDRMPAEQLDRVIDELLAGGGQMRSADSIVSQLRDMPDERFKTRLSRELHISAPAAAGAPEFTVYTITPFICVPEGAALIEFMKRTFDAEEISREPHRGPDSFIAAMRIGDSDLFIMGGESMRGQESPAALHVYVKDCDAVYRRALDAGAVVLPSPEIGAPADRPYGERAAFVSDPFGNHWFIASRFDRDYIGQGLGHVTPCMFPSSAPPLIDFLERAFEARVEGRKEGGRLVHAFVRIGEAMVEMAEAKEPSRPFGFYMHTDDVNALYRQAIEAGAISVLPPADQDFGERLAIVQDPDGNRWFAAKRIARG